MFFKVGQESAKVAKEKAQADEEEKKVAVIKQNVSVKQAQCEKDLKKAEPALVAAKNALNTLNKVSILSERMINFEKFSKN